MKTIMALSGGLDSTTLLAYLLHEGREVECVSFEYGSKHNQYERKAAEEVARYYSVPLHKIDLTPIMKEFKSDLLKTGGDIPEGHYTDATMSRTVVPGRNIIFLSILTGLAWSVEASKVAIGIHAGDHAIYADCRTEFYKAMDLAVCLGSDKRVEIEAPFVEMNKISILEWGLRHNVPYELTRTCYKNQAFACGKCGACQERLEAFRLNKTIDDVVYEVMG